MCITLVSDLCAFLALFGRRRKFPLIRPQLCRPLLQSRRQGERSRFCCRRVDFNVVRDGLRLTFGHAVD